jgi:N-acetylneuraminic acid mutarotase
MSSINAPIPRWAHTAVWTGTRMIVWGGTLPGGTSVDTGGRYDPLADSWTATSTTNAPVARTEHVAVWTGSRMLVWGGIYETPTTPKTPLTSGGRYDPATDTWSSMSVTNAPRGADASGAVWTGDRMVVFGGALGCCGSEFDINDAGSYDPVTDTWTVISNLGGPSPRRAFAMVHTGTDVIVWGGAVRGSTLNDGFLLGASGWVPMSTTGAPAGRTSMAYVWTGSQMVVWGGTHDFITVLNTGGVYTPP